jgi:hypothetical protein
MVIFELPVMVIVIFELPCDAVSNVRWHIWFWEKTKMSLYCELMHLCRELLHLCRELRLVLTA